MEPITSRDNQRLVHARKVRDGQDDAFMFIEGQRLAAEALSSHVPLAGSFISEAFSDQEFVNGLRGTLGDINVVSEKVFNSITDTKNSQGIVLIAERPQWREDQIASGLKTATVPIVVYLDEVNNPSNLGAIVRTVEAAGAVGVMTSPGSAHAFSTKALRGSMGSAFRLPIMQNVSFEDACAFAGRMSMTTVAADLGGSTEYTAVDWRSPHLLVLGSEAHGLTDAQLSVVDTTAQIPLDMSVESLNLGVAAGVILFEARRQCAVSD